MDFAVLIPAYNPPPNFLKLVYDLVEAGIKKIVIVNDGTEEKFLHFFEKISHFPQIEILSHAVNLGKGAALKTGLNYFYTHESELSGVVTADADGQHALDDIIDVGNFMLSQQETLILGARNSNKNVPFRSKLGKTVTKRLYRLVVGQKINDSQSGLRGIPKSFIPDFLKISSNGYEFELDMLLTCKYTQRKVMEKEIKTIYLEGNKSSHYSPILDSLKIYFVLFRSIILSFATFCVDITVFSLARFFGLSILSSQALARAVSIVFYYPLAKKAVFFSDENNKIALPKYIFLVFMSGVFSYALINLLIYEFNMGFIQAKILAESVIYIFNFAIQREFIFIRKRCL